jgi:long-chain acyl-CoA synthetase
LVDLESGLDEVAPGEPGELVLRSPQAMLGYHNPGKGDDQIIKDGWLFTGDVARMDNEGYFFLVDRKRDLIKVGGFQVWPKEVEVILMEHAGVAEAAVSGRKRQEDAKEIVVAWVVLNPGIAMSVEELQIWCSQKLSRYKIPKEIHFVDSLPKSTMGKVLRRKLREKIP